MTDDVKQAQNVRGGTTCHVLYVSFPKFLSLKQLNEVWLNKYLLSRQEIHSATMWNHPFYIKWRFQVSCARCIKMQWKIRAKKVVTKILVSPWAPWRTRIICINCFIMLRFPAIASQHDNRNKISWCDPILCFSHVLCHVIWLQYHTVQLEC